MDSNDTTSSATEGNRLSVIQIERDEAALKACYAFAGGNTEGAREYAWKAVQLDEELQRVEY